MDEKLQLLFIPYLFFSTAINQDAVIKVYSLSVQGFFIKQTKMEEIEKTIFGDHGILEKMRGHNNFPKI
jgi:hypothetical protein